MTAQLLGVRVKTLLHKKLFYGASSPRICQVSKSGAASHFHTPSQKESRVIPWQKQKTVLAPMAAACQVAGPSTATHRRLLRAVQNL